MNRKAVIFGIKSYQLSKKEKFFLKKTKPWGIILFSRNVKSFSQLKSLTSSIKKIIQDKKYPILIDMEGGKLAGHASSRIHQINIVQNALNALETSRPDVKAGGKNINRKTIKKFEKFQEKKSMFF